MHKTRHEVDRITQKLTEKNGEKNKTVDSTRQKKWTERDSGEQNMTKKMD